MINTIVQIINNSLSYILIVLLLICGFYFTFKTKFAQFRLFKKQLKAVTEKPKDKSGVSSFQALMVSTASRVGTGNIIGVSTAICSGGPGAVFWMWLIALIGAATALIESTLAQIFKKRTSSGFCGGPAYYIEAGLRSRRLAIIFTVCLILTYGVGFNMLASYNLQSTFETYSFYNAKYTPWIIGAILALIIGFCLFGGGKRIVKITSVLVPIMGIAYVLVALIIVALNITSLPSILSNIFSDAFNFKAIFGGFSGSCVMFGIKRGLFSNEAGVGSAPNASASADVNHPVTQGLVQMLSVFIDTIVICSATAFMCLCSGVEPSAAVSGAPYVQQSLFVTLGNFGPVFITVAMILFAFTTLLGNLYYVDRGMLYLMNRVPGKNCQAVYRILASLIILAGAVLSADLLWGIADITMSTMALINIPAIIILGKYAFGALKDYDTQKHNPSEKIHFSAKSTGLPFKTDCWK